MRRFCRVKSEGSVRALGRPCIRIVKGASLTLRNNVVLNSWARGYHSAMHSRTSLVADATGAEIAIGDDSRNNGAVIHAQSLVEIGRRVLIAAQATVMDSNAHKSFPAHLRGVSRDTPTPVIIEDDVWVGLNAVVLPGSRIGKGSIIGANAVVSGQIPEDSIVRPVMDVSVSSPIPADSFAAGTDGSFVSKRRSSGD